MLVTFRISCLGFGGAERVFLSVAKHLKNKYGYHIDFVVDRLNGGETEDCALTAGYDLVSLDVSRTWRSIDKFSEYLNDRKPSVVISAYTETNASAILGCLISNHKCPVIVSEHASLDEHWADKKIFRRILLEFVVRYIYRLSSKVIAVSKGLSLQISQRLNGKFIPYIYNPVRFSGVREEKQSARRRIGIRNDVFMILAVGRVAKPKNYLMLLKSLVNVKSHRKVILYIVGGIYDHVEKTKLDEFINEYALEESVVFSGFSHDVGAYYSAADVFALSSAWEGFGNVLVEALYHGLPIVSTNCNHGPSEILNNGEFGILVDVDDDASMAAGINLYANGVSIDHDKQIQRSMDFTEDKIGDRYRELILELVNG